MWTLNGVKHGEIALELEYRVVNSLLAVHVHVD